MRNSLSVIDYQRSFSRTAELAYSLFTIFMVFWGEQLSRDPLENVVDEAVD
jgi:hypothetical protein